MYYSYTTLLPLPLPTSTIISHHGFAVVVLHTNIQQHALHAAQPIAAGEIISLFNAKETVTRPSYLTVQVGIDKHITLMP
ncbi:MAG: hypothetical protein QM541_01825 [Flavobacterium sp.]|nr:hypothetical protein [Flavobacterium sp.]